jgi:hypothetical protein
VPWVILAVITWVVGLLVVPQEAFRRLVPFSLIAGFGLALLINLLGVSVFHLWGFSQPIWPLLGIPFWALLSWIPSVIVFAYFLPSGSLARLAWVLLFPAGYTAIDFLLLKAGLRFFAPGWNLPQAFLLSLAVHLLVLSFYLVSVRHPEATLSQAATKDDEPGIRHRGSPS